MIIPLKNKRGGFVELYLLMVITLVILFFSGVFIYVGLLTQSKLHETMDGKDATFGGTNVSKVIDETVGSYNNALSNLSWITVFLIFAMVLGIFIGSYFVTTHPVMFIPYLIMTIVAIIISVIISNAYETMINFQLTHDAFATLTGANYFMLNLPIYISIIGIAGGVIMFIRWATRDQYA